jgi:NADH-quinone oxidoreductase subunit G
VWTRGAKPYRITPRRNDDVNSNWMPDSHRLAFHPLYSEARLTEPLAKRDGQHVPVSWKEALGITGDALKSFEPSRVAIVASGRMTNEELFLAGALAAELGTKSLAIVPRTGEADSLLVAADRNPNTTGAKLVWNSEDPSAALASIREGVERGEINAVIALGEDLTAEAGFTATQLAKVDFLLQVTTLANPTGALAHLVLPAAGFAEKRGSMVNLSGRLQRLNRAVEPPASARDDWEILRDLILAFTGGKNEVFAIEDIFKVMAENISAFQGLSLSKLGDFGVPVVETGYEIPLLTNERARKAAGLING